jgi:tetratricopeptide (TPR) repeat protein
VEVVIVDSPSPSDPSPDEAERQAKAAQRRARQRRQRLLQAALLIGVAVVVVIMAGSDARPAGTSQTLTPAEARWFTATALLGLGSLLLAVLGGIIAVQWPWRRRFVLRRGGLLGAVWAVMVLIWLPGPSGQPGILIVEIAIVLLGVGAGAFLRFRQRRASQYDPTPEAQAQAIARQQAIVTRNLNLNSTAAATAYYNAAMIEQQRGNLVEARRNLQEALALSEETDDAPMQVQCLNALGQVARAEVPRRALAYDEQALARFRQEVKGRFRWQKLVGLESDAITELMLLNNLGSAHLGLGQPAQALPPLEEALAIYRHTQEPRATLPALLINLGQAHARLGHTDQAHALADSARAALDTTADLRPAQRAFLEQMLAEVLEPPPAMSPDSISSDSALPPESPVG